MDGNRVTWRLEILRGWGERLDPEWLPSGGTESWRRIFESEDLAGRIFAGGGAGMRWHQLAGAAGSLTAVVEQYRLQCRVAEQVAGRCPLDAAGHVRALAVPDWLRPPRRTRPDGRWRLCELGRGGVVSLGEFDSADLGEGAAVAARTGRIDVARWAEPVSARPAQRAGRSTYWTPAVDTDLRLAAFAAEEAVADLARAASTGHCGPDVLSTQLVCTLGMATYQFVKEYRTLLCAVWTHLEACPRAVEHDAEAEKLLAAVGDGPAGPDGRWRHAALVLGSAATVSEHDDHAAAAESVAAHRATDERTVRWAEPLASR